METVTLKLAKVGNSLGAIFPANIVKEQHMKPGEEIVVTIEKKSNVLKKLFGSSKSKRPTEEILQEVRKEMESKWMK